MSRRIPPRPAQTKRPASMAERLSGGDLWEKPTKPDEDFRLLAKNPGMTRADYVDFPGRAVKEEPEAVDRDTLREMANANNDRFAATHAEERRRREVRSLAAEVREVGNLALQREMDLPELHRIRAELDSARKRLKAAA